MTDPTLHDVVSQLEKLSSTLGDRLENLEKIVEEMKTTLEELTEQSATKDDIEEALAELKG